MKTKLSSSDPIDFNGIPEYVFAICYELAHKIDSTNERYIFEQLLIGLIFPMEVGS